MVVMNEDQKWLLFKNGSYKNESPLSTFDQVTVHSTFANCKLGCGNINL
jgi:hypothetical protein